MSNPNAMDKVNMSLDDIIKKNKNQFRPNKFKANNNNNGNNKSFGLLNKSKNIRKNNFRRNNRNNNNNNNNNIRNNNNNNGFRQNGNGNGVSRRRFRNKASLNQIRASRVNNQQRGIVMNKRFANRLNFGKQNQQQNNGASNMGFQNRQNKNAARSIQARIQARKKIQRTRPQNGGAIKRTGGLNIRNRIALQTARKNVQKAKRLLATRKSQMKQLLTNKFTIKDPANRARTQNAMRPKQKNAALIRKVAQQNKTVRVNVPNKFRQQNVVKNFKKPILRRNRQGQQQNGASRTVFF